MKYWRTIYIVVTLCIFAVRLFTPRASGALAIDGSIFLPFIPSFIDSMKRRLRDAE